MDISLPARGKEVEILTDDQRIVEASLCKRCGNEWIVCGYCTAIIATHWRELNDR